jgi:RND family efflux transporter MFP subunit
MTSNLEQTVERSKGPTTAGKVARGVALAMVPVLLALLAYVPRWRHDSEVRAETVALAIATVRVASPAPSKGGAGLVLPAEIAAFAEASVYARASGYLRRRLVDIGARVQAGQLLAEIATPELAQELLRSRAELRQAEASLALATTTEARWAEAARTDSVSEQESAEKRADLAVKSATVAAARANVRRLEELVSFGKVTAPFAGTITARRTDVGELIVAGGAKELFHLAQTSTLRVFVRVPQPMTHGIAPGQLADLTVSGLRGRSFPAKVARTAGAISTDSRTLLVELEVDNAQGDILAGSFGQVRFAEVNAPAALTLPASALIFRAEGPQVAVVKGDGTVELRSVKVGRDFGQTLEIASGVSPTDQVILGPSDSLNSGNTVRVAASAAPDGKP